MSMKAMKTFCLCAVLAGCAGLYSTAKREPLAGRWRGVVDREGWPEAVTFRFDHGGGPWEGEWQLGGLRQPLQHVEVQGDDVQFETEEFRFAAHVQGDTLAGTVSRRDVGTAEARFSAEHQDRTYSPGSEPSFPGIR